MSFCIVPGCRNRISIENAPQEEKEQMINRSLSFHSFPNDNGMRQKWLEALNMDKCNPLERDTVCSVHFKETDYDTINIRRTLKANAVPFLTEEYACKVGTYKEPSEENIQNDGASSEEVKRPEEASTTKIYGINTERTSRSTSISPERILNSPTKKRLREVHVRQMTALKRKLAVTAYKHPTAPKKLYSIKYVLKELEKNNLIRDEIIVLESFESYTTRDLIKCEIRKRKQLPVPKIYKPSIREFALSLHFYSPRAYNHVRNKFYKCLPHTKTISKWYVSFNGEPGINSESLKAIRKFADSVPYKLIGSLMFEEIDIREGDEYYQGKFVGHSDCGNNIACDIATLARRALVFCIVCLNASWKLPIAYYLINNTSTEQTVNLIKQCLIAVQEAGLLVTALTCDGYSCHKDMLRRLGCNFDMELTFQAWFKHPANDSNVYVFLNPRHLMTRVRIALASGKKLYDDTENIIKWKHVVNLQKLQEAERLYLTNKITFKHMQYHSNSKIKVKSAMQLLNFPMTNAMIICKNKLRLPEFTDCLPTVKFITLFNDLFDIFNSINLRQHGLKKPIHDSNYVQIDRKLQECANYIKSLSIGAERRSVLNSRVKMGFRGFLINIKSLLHMYKFVCTDNDLLKYIPTYKLSMDNIDLIFNYLRPHYEYNTNPTVVQFKSAYKKLITHTELRNKNNGTCTPLEDIAILHMSSEQPVNIINATTNIALHTQWLNMFDMEHKSHLDYSSLQTRYSSPITEYKTEVISYIAGYILKELTKPLHCTVCLDTLIGQPHVNLINKKNKRRLIYPSRDLIYVCKITENTISNLLNTNKTLKHFNMHSFTCRVMQEFTDSNIFAKLNEHINDQCLFSNHRNNLLRSTIILYAKIRFALY